MELRAAHTMKASTCATAGSMPVGFSYKPQPVTAIVEGAAVAITEFIFSELPPTSLLLYVEKKKKLTYRRRKVL